jgi:peroxiredoxin
MEIPIRPGDRPANFRLCTMGGVSKALRDFRGRKTVVFAWAPWCGSREFLGPLQRFHERHPGVHVVGVAFDAQGVDMPLKYLTGARVTFEMLLDAGCILSRKWGIKRPGLLVLLDENGTALLVVDHPEEKDLEKVENHLADKPVAPVPPEAKVDPRDVKVELLVQACTNFLTRKKVQEAVESLRKALAADPGNLIIARQVLVLQHPEKFYPGPIDREWVERQPPVAPL